MWLCRVDRRMRAAAFCRTGNHFWIHAPLTPHPHGLALHSTGRTPQHNINNEL